MFRLNERCLLKKTLIGMLVIIMFAGGLFKTSYASNIKEELDNKEIQNFINQYMQREMEKEHIVGAAVVVVKGNKEVLKKGYGYSNIEQHIVVDPDVTTFPIASVSKLFTATAIMQLYSEGKIDLSENVENYIEPLKIKNPHKENVTCANLLTHSSGMDEASELLGSTTNEKEIKSQEEYFENHPLVLVEKPNTVSRYSNLGYNLLGYIIEKVSSLSYEEYIEQNILKPLEMNHSSVRLHDEHMASGYMYMEGQYIKMPYAYQYTSGSAGVITTVSDIENFMIMHLNEGTFDKKIILEADAECMMHKKMFSNDTVLPGMAYGFIRSERNGQEILKHEGALPGYMSTMLLLPDQNLGIFVTVNTFSPLPFNFEEAFLNHFFSQERIKDIRLKNLDNHLKRYVGTYRNYDGMAQSNLMMCGVPLESSTDLVIKENKDGTLRLEEYTQARKKISTRLYEVEKGRFIREDGQGNFAFRVDERGKITYAFNEVSHNAYERILWYQKKGILIGIIAGSLLLFLIDIGVMIFGLIKRKNEKCDLKRKLKWGHLVGDAFTIIGSIGAIYLLQIMINNYDYRLVSLLYILLTCIIIGFVWTIVRTILFIKQLIKEKISSKELIYNIFVILFSLLYNMVLYYCHLIGYKIS